MGWTLATVSLDGPPSAVILSASHDGRVLAVKDDVFAGTITLIVDGEGRELVMPNHQPGGVPVAFVSPDGAWVVINEVGLLFRYDVAADVGEEMDQPVAGGSAAGFCPDGRLAVLTGTVAGELGGVTDTAIYLVDVPTGTATALGTRSDAVGVFPASDGVAALVDDETGWALLHVGADGHESQVSDLDAAVTRLVVAPDLSAVATTDANGRVTLLLLPEGDEIELPTLIPIDFSPDGSLLRGTMGEVTLAIDRSGTQQVELESIHTVWVGR